MTAKHARRAEPGWFARWSALAPTLTIDAPHVRLGLLWFIALVPACVVGSAPLSVLMAVTGVAAATQAARSTAGHDSEAIVPLCALAGGALPAMAAVGTIGVGLAGALVVIACFAWEPVRALAGRYTGTTATSASRSAVIAILVGLGCAAPVLARGMGLAQGLALIVLISLHDASTYIVGSGAGSRWEGPAAGAAAIGAASLAVAAVLVPPFRGASPWALGLVLILLVPAGPSVATALLGERSARVPILRRIDSYLLAGPVWVVLARILT